MDKQSKREARKLRQEAKSAHDRGDYLRAAQIDRQVLERYPDTEFGAEARAELERHRVDPWALRAGLVAAAICLVAWLASAL